MNPEAESIDLGLSWTRRAIQGLARRRRAVNEIGACPGSRLVRAALLIVVLAINAAVAVPASALARRESRVVVNRGQATRLQGWQRRTVDPLLQAPHSAAGTSTLGPVNPFSGFGSSLRGSAPVGTGPSTVAINPATHTIYVANGYNDNGPELPTPGNTVSVINARDCQAQDVSRCQGPWPTITVGNMPSAIAIDKRTDTVYVSNVQDNTVSVFNGATCNAENTSGCGQTPATVPVGLDPLGLFADPANHTVYVPDYGAIAVGGPQDSTTVSMLDSATCNATDLAGCPTTPPPTVDVKASPDDVAVDPATHTVYVTTVSNGNPGSNSGWTVFDANTCNATVQSGCATIGYLTGDPIGPNAAQVDTANDTLYTANFDTTVSAFDLHHCNAGDLAGCASDVPGTVTVPGPIFGDHALWLAVDTPLHSVYVVYQKDDALKVIDTNVCSGARPGGCATLIPPEIHAGADPESVILDPRTQTLYTANWVDNDVSVIDPTRCDAQTISGCRHRAPEVPIPAAAVAADPAVHTTYVGTSPTAVAMINTSDCNAFHAAGCSATPPTFPVANNGRAIAVDPRTHTVYVANSGSGATRTVSVFDDRTCNATRLVGCSTVSTLQVPGGNPNDIAVNPATGTVYVATITGSGPNLISVFNGATCNATDTAGCDQTPATVMFGDSGAGNGGSVAYLAVDHATNTVYAINVVLGHPFVGDSVFVIDGATCDATDTTGCGQTPATVTLGSDPLGIAYNPSEIAVDQATDTIYTANIADGEGPGTVSVINGANCNGHDTNGCGQTPATAPAGFGASGIAVDRTTHEVYVTNTEDTSVSVIDGTKCNGTDTSGCSHTPAKDSVGGYPASIAIDPAVRTAYVQTIDGVSVIPLTH
jgi:DNA-binding beta-propeller fold protein YncE